MRTWFNTQSDVMRASFFALFAAILAACFTLTIRYATEELYPYQAVFFTLCLWRDPDFANGDEARNQKPCHQAPAFVWFARGFVGSGNVFVVHGGFVFAAGRGDHA